MVKRGREGGRNLFIRDRRADRAAGSLDSLTLTHLTYLINNEGVKYFVVMCLSV